MHVFDAGLVIALRMPARVRARSASTCSPLGSAEQGTAGPIGAASESRGRTLVAHANAGVARLLMPHGRRQPRRRGRVTGGGDAIELHATRTPGTTVRSVRGLPAPRRDE